MTKGTTLGVLYYAIHLYRGGLRLISKKARLSMVGIVAINLNALDFLCFVGTKKYSLAGLLSRQGTPSGGT